MLIPRTRIANLTLIIAAAICLLIGTPARGQTPLSYKFKKGDTLKYTVAIESAETDRIGSGEHRRTTNQGMDLVWTVKNGQGGQAEIAEKISQFRRRLESTVVRGWEFDSKTGKKLDGQAGKDLNPLMEALVGAELSLKMDSQGAVTDVKLFHKMLEAIKANPNLAPPWSPFSEELITYTLRQPMLVFPKEPVFKGKTWSQKTQFLLPNQFVFKLDTMFTYAGPETRQKKTLEKVVWKSALTVDGGEAAALEPSLKSSDIQGIAYFDNKAGRLVESTQSEKWVIAFAKQTYGSSRDQTTTIRLAP